jgi:two-component system sensor histidine kinase GlrK
VTLLRSPSIVQLILIAFIAISLPLVWAIFTTLYQVDKLVESNVNVISKVKKESVMSRELADQLTSLERSARQYQVLGDDTIQVVYIGHRSQFDMLLNQLIVSGPSEKKLKMAVELREKELTLFSLVKPKLTKEELINTDRTIVDLHKQVEALLTESDLSLAEKTDDLTSQAQELKQQLIAQAALALPITLALVILFTLLITRPIRQLSASIHALGQGDLKQDVAIRGPHDIQNLSVRLNGLRQKLYEVEQQKQAFLRNISHELKTPLASIREGAELLHVGHDPSSQEEQREIIGILKSSSLHLQKLIEGLLHFNELTAVHGDQHLIQLPDFFDSVVSPYQLSLRQKNLSVEKTIDTGGVNFNYHSLKLIVDNLLSNAIKFSPENEIITVSIKKERSCLSIVIADNGEGVDDEEKDKIFELFYKNEKGMSTPLSSNGLGLAIVKEIVTRAHGTIELYSRQSVKNKARKNNKGNTQFIVLLPIPKISEVTIRPIRSAGK